MVCAVECYEKLDIWTEPVLPILAIGPKKEVWLPDLAPLTLWHLWPWKETKEPIGASSELGPPSVLRDKRRQIGLSKSQIRQPESVLSGHWPQNRGLDEALLATARSRFRTPAGR